MAINSRLTAVLAAGGLIAAGLAAVATAAPASAGDTFVERWCSSNPAPCVLSAKLNGVAMSPGDPVEVQMIPRQVGADQDYTEIIVQDPTDTVKLLPTDTVEVFVDLGTMAPETTESYAFQPDVDRFNDGDGTYRLRFTGHPVLLTSGCTDTYPNHCTDSAETQKMTFDVTVIKQKVNHDFAGFDRAQSADTVDGIYLIEGAGGDYLESNWDNSRFLTDGVTRAKASARFRIPYAMLETDFKVPAPETMVASSIAGSVNGVPTSFDFSQDPDGGGVYVDITGVTFPPGDLLRAVTAEAGTTPRRIRVKRGSITPTRPVVQRATRTAPKRARVTFLRAKPRGAYVTGYQARCQAAGRPTVIVNGRYPTIVVTGLRPGTKYLCSVRAKSRVGYGAWSLRKKV